MSNLSSAPSRRWRIFLLIGAGISLLWLWPSLSRLFWQIIFAALLAAAAAPLSNLIERKFPRSVSALLALGIFFLGAIGFFAILLPLIISQFSQLIQQAPRLFSFLQNLWTKITQGEWIQSLGLLPANPEKWLGKIAGYLAEKVPLLLSKLGAGADFISRTFLSPVLAYYFLRDRETFAYRLSLWIPFRYRKQALTAFQEMRREAGGYLRGQMLVSTAVAALTALGLLLTGIPAWLALGLLMGLCEMIPYIGPIIGAIPILIFSLPLGMDALLRGLGVAIAVQQIEGFFLSPHLMAGATGLHPVSVILLLSVGGLLWGLWGMMIALPLFVCLRGAARVFSAQRPQPQL